MKHRNEIQVRNSKTQAHAKISSKGILALLLTLVLAVGMITPALALSNTDVDVKTEKEIYEAERLSGLHITKEEVQKADLAEYIEMKERQTAEDATESDEYGISTLASTSSIYAAWNDTTLILFSDPYQSWSESYPNAEFPNFADITGQEYSVITEPPWYDNAKNFKSVYIKDTIRPQSTSEWFWDMVNVSLYDGLANIDMSSCTNMEYMFGSFSENTATTSVSGIENWDVSKVEDMDLLFHNMNALTQDTLNVKDWNTASLKQASNIFYCKSNTHLDLSGWDLSKMETGIGFPSCYNADVVFPTAKGKVFSSNLTRLSMRFTNSTLDVSNWDISGLATTDGMFSFCDQLKELDISNWDLSNVRDADDMFENCTSLETVTFPSSSNKTLNNASLFGIFAWCDSLTNVYNIDKWTIGEESGYSSYMFAGCESLKTMDLSSWDLSYMYDLDDMFYGCSNLESVYFTTDPNKGPVPVVWPKHTGDPLLEVDSMFEECSSLKEVDLSAFPFNEYVLSSYDWANTGMSPTSMFGGCTSLEKVTFGVNATSNLPELPTQASANIANADGYWYTSSGQKYAGNNIPAGANTYYATPIHVWDNGTVTKSATCTDTGVKTYTCTGCGATYTESINATGHNWDNGKVTSSQTCTAEGVLTYTCKNCSATETVAITANGHTEVTDPAVAPACDTNGLTEGSHCSVCGAVIKAQEVINATGHDYTDPQYEWQNSGAVVVSNIDSVRNELVSLAEKQIGVPYVFSGKSPSEGFDCSGLTYYLYKTVTGIELPWNVDDLNEDTGIRYGQNLCGDEITRGSDYNEFVNKLKVGDLVFMNKDPDDGTPTHVGIFVGTDNNGVSWIIDACYDDGMVIQEDMYNRWEQNPENGKIITGARRIIVGTSDFTTGALMTLSCVNCDDVETVDCDVELASVDEPTCTDEGTGHYTITGQHDGKTYTGELDKTINPKGHSYSVISCSMAENNDSEIMQLGAKTYALVQDSTITIGCNDCDDVEIIDDCETELTNEQNATCGENGFITYTITGEYNGRTYTAQFTSELLATDEHNWDMEDVDIIDIDVLNGTVTVEFHCLDCDATTQATAPLEFKVYSDVSGEYTSVTMYATLIVGDKEYHFEQTVSAQAQQEMDTHDWVLVSETEATCKDNGEKYYECSKDGCDATKTVITPASNHSWNIEWDWASDYSSCVAYATCSVCGTTETKTCTIVGPVTVGDRIAYTATAVFSDGQQFSSAKYTDSSEVGALGDSGSGSSSTSGTTAKAASPEASSEETTESASSEGTGTGTNAVVTTDNGTDNTASGGTVSSAGSSGTSTSTPTASTATETATPKTGDDDIIWLCAFGTIAIATAGAVLVTKPKHDTEG